MPRDSQGNFTNVYNWPQDAANGIGIEPDRHQEGDDDQAQGLTDSLDRKGRGGMQAALAMGNFAITQVAEGTAATDGLNIAQAQKQTYSTGTDTGTANSYIVALSPAPAAYVTGMIVRFVATNANTGASTLQVNGLTPAPALQWHGKDLVANTIAAGASVEAVFTGSAFDILNPPEILPAAYGGTGTADGVTYTNNFQVFTSSGNFEKANLPANVTHVTTWVCGAGGGGGGAIATTGSGIAAGAGGGAGGWALARFAVSSLPALAPVVVGTGGAGGNGVAGSTGGGSSFNGAFTAPGGNGGNLTSSGSGAFTTVAGAVGGTPTGGAANAQGGAGGLVVGSGTVITSGHGGNSFFGGGATARTISGTDTRAGVAATAPGGGGGGAANGQSQAAATGGNGANGIVIVFW